MKKNVTYTLFVAANNMSQDDNHSAAGEEYDNMHEDDDIFDDEFPFDEDSLESEHEEATETQHDHNIPEKTERGGAKQETRLPSVEKKPTSSSPPAKRKNKVGSKWNITQPIRQLLRERMMQSEARRNNIKTYRFKTNEIKSITQETGLKPAVIRGWARRFSAKMLKNGKDQVNPLVVNQIETLELPKINARACTVMGYGFNDKFLKPCKILKRNCKKADPRRKGVESGYHEATCWIVSWDTRVRSWHLYVEFNSAVVPKVLIDYLAMLGGTGFLSVETLQYNNKSRLEAAKTMVLTMGSKTNWNSFRYEKVDIKDSEACEILKNMRNKESLSSAYEAAIMAAASMDL